MPRRFSTRRFAPFALIFALLVGGATACRDMKEGADFRVASFDEQPSWGVLLSRAKTIEIADAYIACGGVKWRLEYKVDVCTQAELVHRVYFFKNFQDQYYAPVQDDWNDLVIRHMDRLDVALNMLLGYADCLAIGTSPSQTFAAAKPC